MSKIKVKVNYSLLLFLLVMLFLSKYTEIFVIISTILIHELAHIACAYIFGYRSFKIELSMFGGMCYVDIDDRRKISSIIIYLSGIMINLIIVIISYILEKDHNQEDVFLNVIRSYRHYNILIMIFSILPIYPLDGYRVINVFLRNSYKISYISIIILFIINIYYKSMGLFILTLFLVLKNRKIKEEEISKKLRTIYKNLINTNKTIVIKKD